MAHVILKRNFFTSGGRFKRSVNNKDWRYIPDHLCFAPDGKRLLPSDAVVRDDNSPPLPLPEPKRPDDAGKNELHNLDTERQALEAAGVAGAKADKAIEENKAALAFQEQLRQEQAASRDTGEPAPARNRVKPKRPLPRRA